MVCHKCPSIQLGLNAIESKTIPCNTDNTDPAEDVNCTEPAVNKGRDFTPGGNNSTCCHIVDKCIGNVDQDGQRDVTCVTGTGMVF